jgi:hypothetical protein
MQWETPLTGRNQAPQVTNIAVLVVRTPKNIERTTFGYAADG